MDKKVTTTNITYQFDDMTGKMVEKTIVETEATSEPASAEYEIETGVELDSVIEMLPLEILLMTTVGALLGNLIYRVIHKD